MTACGQALQPQPTPARSKRQQHLTELVRCQAQLLDLLVAQHQQAQALTPLNLPRQAQSLVRRLQRDIQQIEAQLQHLRQPEASLEQRAQKLEAIPGVGTLTALAVLAELPELGTLNHRQAAALAGGVPIRARAAPGRGAAPLEADGPRCGARST